MHKNKTFNMLTLPYASMIELKVSLFNTVAYKFLFDYHSIASCSMKTLRLLAIIFNP